MTQTGDPERVSEALSRDAVAWVDRLKSGAMTRAEAETLRAWRRQSPEHARAFAEAAVLVQAVGAAAAGLRSSVVALPKREVDPGRRAFIGAALAASGGGLVLYGALKPPLGLWPSVGDLARDLRADYRTGVGQQQRFALGSSTLALNTQTLIARVSGAHGGGVELIRGEAALDAHGPFLMRAADGAISTDAGGLNVRVDPDQVCVTCLTGGADLAHPLGRVRLGAGQQVIYAHNKLGRPAMVDTSVVAAWREGALIFHDQPLSMVIAEVNRYRNGRILIANPAIGRRRVYASFHLNRINSVVEQVQRLSGARITELGSIVILS